jgi:hypothetical protein
MRRTLRLLPAMLFALTLALAAPIATNILSATVPERWKNIAGWLSALVMLFTAVLVCVEAYRRGRSSVAHAATLSTRQLDEFADRLADTVRFQWHNEIDTRRLHSPAPLAATWWIKKTAGATSYGRKRQQLRGDLRDIVATFRALRKRHVVIVGAEGAGKSVLAMLLTTNLIRTRKTDEPVPVLLSLSDWEPAGEHLANWLARRLAEEYPAICSLEVARELVYRNRILPVLDGLDEVLPTVRTALVTAINRMASAACTQIVVTSQCGAAETPTEVAERVLPGASILRIEPVTVDDAIVFLSRPRTAGDANWERILKYLRSRPGSPLAQAFSSPLMLYLAASSIAAVDLTDNAAFPDQASIEAHLLTGFVPAAYPDRLRHFGLQRLGTDVNVYRREPAERWLRFLAGHLHRIGSPVFAWWQLSRAAGTAFVAVAALLVAGLAALLFRLIGADVGGCLLAAGIIGPATAAVLWWTGGPPTIVNNADSPTPHTALVRERARTAARSSVAGLVFGSALGVVFTGGFNLGGWLALWFIGAFGLTFGIAALLDYAWTAFLIARLWLGVTGRLPFRLAAFLADAHRRGVLRQVGARYEFRHARFQQHLLGTAPVPRRRWWQPRKESAEPLTMRVRVCAGTSAVLLFAGLLSATTAPAPYLTGDRPTETTMTVCIPDSYCKAAHDGYHWTMRPGAKVDTTFGGVTPPRILRQHRVTGALRVERGTCPSAIQWQLLLDGDQVTGGTVNTEHSHFFDVPAPGQITRIRITAERSDHADCAADLVLGGPMVVYRV